MARRQLPSYEAMTLAPQVTESSPGVIPPVAYSQMPLEGSGQTLKDVSAHLMLYLHRDAAKALQRNT